MIEGIASLVSLLFFSINVGLAVKNHHPFFIGCAVFTGGCFLINLILMLKKNNY